MSQELFALDTGGTMTDSFVVDGGASYTVGKAQTTPDREADGVVESLSDALEYWDTSLADLGDGSVRGTIYSGTAMLNRLLEREGDGESIGIITNRGFEDTLRFGRGIQSWVDQSYAGRLHARAHEHPEPLVPRKNIHGVRSRIHVSGEELIPVYEADVRKAFADLLEKDVDIICVCLLFAHINDAHEMEVGRIAEEILKDRDASVTVWLSSEQNPVQGELPRLNTLVLEAYAVEPSRHQFNEIDESLESFGIDAPFRILTSAGGTVSPQHDWLADTIVSGPIGGIFGGEFLATELGISNLVCSDVGGTSFDVGLITEGHYPTRWDRSIAQSMVNIPIVAMDTIGSGTGSYVRVDRESTRIEVGPDSAGYLVGVSNVDSGLETPTVTDCTALLGYLNPDFFLGGDIDIDVDRAREFIEAEIADPLGEDPYDTARGVLDIVERNMTNELKSMVLGLGYAPENYKLISYGGGGPLHAAGYTAPLDFEEVLVPEWAAAFSAFGCATADYAYRYDRSLNVQIPPDLGNLDRVAAELSGTLLELRENAHLDFERDGVDLSEVTYEPSVRLQYRGLLDDLEIDVPATAWDEGIDAEGVETLIDRYDTEFSKIFQRAAQSPENGYTITMAIGTGVAPSPKPTLPEASFESETPPDAASKGERELYWDGRWYDGAIWDMEGLRVGNVVTGPAVIEAPATTFLIPPGFEAELDENKIYHLTQESDK